ncbi:MAG: LysR family transcriptional regulator [Lachnospiraceae bacterium]|jgi:LysR family transcriptional activator of glutamate synthase operon
MNTTYFKEFIALAECCNYEKAAEDLYTTQSTLSKHIQKMENELGILLFERTSRKVKLSKCGELLLPYARKTLELENEYTALLSSYAAKSSNSLSIGSVTNMAAYGISNLLVSFQKNFPDYRIDISGTSPYVVYRQLLDGKYDLAFLRYNTKMDMSHFHSIPFTTDRLVLACSKNHPMASRGKVSLMDFKDDFFIMFKSETFMHDFINNAFQEIGFHPHISLYAHRSENLLELATQELGVCLLMKKMAQAINNPNVVLLELKESFPCNIAICYLKNKPLSKSAKSFIHFFEERIT